MSGTGSFYAYDPSTSIPIIFAGVFAVIFVAHAFLAFRASAYGYMWAFVLGSLGETLGYAARYLSVKKPTVAQGGKGLYILTTLFIILSPSFLAASLYMVYGRLVLWVGEKYSIIRAKRVTLIFVTFDVVSFLVQALGGSLFTSDSAKTQKLARNILIGGFIIQITSFSIFLLCSALYLFKARRSGIPTERWTTILYALYAVGSFIFLRTIYRTIEYITSQSSDTGYLLTHESFVWIFEAAPIVTATTIFVLFHPAKYIPNDKSERIEYDGVSSMESRIGLQYIK